MPGCEIAEIHNDDPSHPADFHGASEWPTLSTAGISPKAVADKNLRKIEASHEDGHCLALLVRVQQTHRGRNLDTELRNDRPAEWELMLQVIQKIANYFH